MSAQFAHEEFEMTRHGAADAVIVAHDVEAFAQRFEPVAGGGAFVKVVDEDFGDEHIAARMLKHADAPVEIGREPEFQIVGRRDLSECYKSLMAYHHAVGEALQRQLFGCGQVARTDAAAVGVHYVSLAVDHAGIVLAHYGVGDALQRVGRMECVAGIEKNHVIAGGLRKALVHGIVNAAVGGRTETHERMQVAAGNLYGAVRRIPVDDEMFVQIACLPAHAFNGDRERVGSIVRYGDDGKQRSVAG